MSRTEPYIDEGALQAIVTHDIGRAFLINTINVQRDVREIVSKNTSGAVTAKALDQYVDGRIRQITELFLAKLVHTLDMPHGSISPFIGRAHFDYSEGGVDTLSGINNTVDLLTEHEITITKPVLRMLQKLKHTIDNYPLGRHIILPFPQSDDTFAPQQKESEDPDADDYKEWRARVPRGIRTPEDIPWAPRPEEVGHVCFLPGLATICTKSMLDEFQATGEDGRPLPFPITSFPATQEFEYNMTEVTESIQDSMREEDGSSYKRLQTLQQYLSRNELPDVLVVHDPDGLTGEVEQYKFQQDNEMENDESDDDEPASEDKTTETDAKMTEALDDIPASSSRRSPKPVPRSPHFGKIVYRRVNPLGCGGVPFCDPPPCQGPPRPIANLYLSDKAELGSGNGGFVYSAAINLNIPMPKDKAQRAASRKTKKASSPTSTSEPKGAATPGPMDDVLASMDVSSSDRPTDAPLMRFPRRLKVAAKIPNWTTRGRNFVLTEARVYEMFPEYLSQHHTGYVTVPKDHKPRKADAVVPKYYGYYVPDVGYAGTELEHLHEPILLMEECGRPVPNDCVKLPVEHKELLHTLVRRLHRAGFTQNSMSPRNILMQPGPLHVPPFERSLNDPSFRIIDFGRGRNLRYEFKDKVPDAMELQAKTLPEMTEMTKLLQLNHIMS